jgi:glutamyl-tRNA synthetase
VIRGDDHLNNTPRQMNIFAALGAMPPVYAHLPMILGPDRAKLSKRHGAVSVMQYRDDGFLPEAVLNYLVRLGWSHGDEEIFTVKAMTDLFDIADVNQSASAINPDKLLWLNQHYIKHGDLAWLGAELGWHLVRMGVAVTDGPPLAEVVRCQQERVRTLKEMAENSRFFFIAPTEYDPKAVAKHLTAETTPVLKLSIERLEKLSPWAAPAIHDTVTAVATELGVGLGKVAQPLRVAVTGTTVSPPIDATLSLLGKAETLARVERALGQVARLSQIS